MLMECLDHPKTLHLVSLLGVERPTAIGHLELLWAFTAKKSPQGNIGKWPDGAIAQACFWTGNPESFLQSLLQSGFIDADPEHRYVIHDWHDHAPRWVRAKLAKAKLTFVTSAVATTERTTDGTADDDNEGDDDDIETIEPTVVATTEASQSQAKPSQVLAKPSQIPASPPASLGPPEDRGRERKVQDETAKGRTPDTSKRRTPKKPEVPLPDDFQPHADPELEQYAIDHLPDADVPAMSAKFRLQAETKQWRYADWRLAWMTYCRNARVDSGHWAAGQYPRKRPNGSGNGRYRSADEAEDEVIERAISEGLTDEQIAALPQLEIAPNRLARIRTKRREMEAPC